ncbi:GcrA family cell cycle regulator [Ponticaulis profundi]|uniref:GcrA family cell cycle regulator n=1 Tax=Ponticaulis profundi TaxID=2665222 RepID=A0ABW1SCE8_9PROT
MSWTEERVEALKKLWTEGHSASQIANQLGGVTRNAVIGKVHRLGLSGRATPSRPVKRPPRLARPKPTPQRVEQPVKAKVEPEAVEETAATPALPTVAPRGDEVLAPATLSNGEHANVLNLRESMCKWPIGDPMDKDFAFCGRAAADGPYCKEHAKVAFQPKKSRVRKENTVSNFRRAAG